MKKNERGVLTVEASIVLCVFALFILFLFSFATIYRAENMVSHATLQAADAVALESYLRETAFETDEQKVLFWANRLNGQDSISADSFESLRTADLESITKEKFALAIGETLESADNILRKLGIDGGLDGIDFSESYVDLTTNDVIVKANYTMKMKFPVFGADQLVASKSAKAKTAGEILFTINVIPEDRIMGSTTGSGKYRMGTEVEIAATANYGFDFVGWDDGNTENPRSVTVAEAKTYVALFERHNFGVNLFIDDPTAADGRVKGSNAFGTVSASQNGAVSVGGNEYNYQSTVRVQAVENPGYRFLHWTGTKVGDTASSSIYTTDRAFDVYMDGTYDLTAVYEPISYTASVTTSCTAAQNSIGVRRYGTSDYAKSVVVPYGNQIELNAATISGYTFLGWYRDGSKLTSSSYTKIPLPAANCTFEAKYEKDPTITVAANGYGSVKIGANGRTSYCCKKGTSVQITAKPNSGYYFAGWSDGEAAQHSVTVNADVTYTATFKPYPSVSIYGGSTGSASTNLTAATSPSGLAVTWSSSNTGVATVSNGKVEVKKAGTVTIYATVRNEDGKTATAQKVISVGVDKIILEEYNFRTVGRVRHYYDFNPLAGGSLLYTRSLYYNGICEGRTLGKRSYNGFSYSTDYACFYRRIYVTQEQLANAKKVKPNKTSSGNQQGVNMSSKVGYRFDPESGQAGFIFFDNGGRTYKITSIS